MSVDSYTDANNFVNINHVTTYDDKFSKTEVNNYEFLSIKMGTNWVNPNSAWIKTQNISIDGGETFIETTDQIVLGYYFYLNDFTFKHQRKVYGLLDVLSGIGGLATTLLAFAGVIGSVYNSYIYAIHFVHLLYFVRDYKQESSVL